MDKYIFEQFITRVEEDGEKLFKYLILNAQKKIESKDKCYLTYYPQLTKGIELIIESIKDKNKKFSIVDFKFHHLSNQVWDFKIVSPIKTFKNTFLVQRPNNTGASCIRLINEFLLESELKPGTIIKAQVCGIVILADIFKNEDEYKHSIQANKDGNKVIMKDGSLIPYNLLSNNDAKLSKEEREAKNHNRDNLLTFKSKLKNVKPKEIKMFNLDLANYYTATIDTTFGDLDIIIPSSIINKTRKQPIDGDIIYGELLLSGNLCINEYKKLKKES